MIYIVFFKNDSSKEFNFKVTRIRCWKILSIVNGNSNSNSKHLELCFEYLFAKDKFEWITIKSEQVSQKIISFYFSFFIKQEIFFLFLFLKVYFNKYEFAKYDR